MNAETKRYPRTLVVSTTRLGQMTATGAAMFSLFGDWPEDQLFQLHTDKAKGSNEGSNYPEFYIGNEPTRPGIQNLFRALSKRSGRVTYAKIEQWVRERKPEVIYYRAIDKPRFMWWLPVELSDRLGIPLVTHIMDDWPKRLTDAARNENRHGEAERIHDQLARTFHQSTKALSICDKMSRAFEERYGVPFVAFQNTIDRAEWDGVSRSRSYEDDGTFRIVYAGSLADDMTLQSFKELAEAVGVLRDQGKPVQLNVYGARWWQKVFDREVGQRPGVKYVGFVPRARYVQSLVDADLLAMPINFDSRSLNYIRFSLANKAPDYMAAGAPILVYGSPESATVEYAIRHRWAEVVTTQGVDHIAKAVTDLIDHPEKRAAIVEKAAKVGAAFHDSEKNRERFRRLLCEIGGS